jgi:hypothetical protein
MNQLIDPAKSGLAMGVLFGGMHLVWSLLVLVGIAQWLINSILWLHMISMPIAVNTFDLSVAILLVIVTALIGYAVGYVFALVWNRMHRDAEFLRTDSTHVA